MKVAIFTKIQALGTRVLAAIGLVSVIGTQSSFAESLAGSRPNILIIMPDDIGASGLKHLGAKTNYAEHIESLFEKGIRLTDFHVSPTCAPSRAAMLTGRHECYAGVTHTINLRDRMNPEQRLLTHVLKDAGYTTGIFGKWHLGDDDAYLPNARGFDEMYIHGAGGIGQNYAHSADFPNNDYNNPVLLHNDKVIRTEGYCTDLFFDQAIQWITQQHAAGKPFFCFIPTNVTHGPHIPPLKDDGTYYPREEILQNLDANVGKLLKELEAQSLMEDTLILYFADNGGPSFGRLRGSKTSPYQGGSRVPCAMYWKGKLEGGREVSATTAHLDLYTTFAQLVGKVDEPVPGGEAWDGRNMLPLLESADAKWSDRDLVTHKTRWDGSADENQYKNASIRHGDFQLVWNPKGEVELYDLKKDLQQKQNIAAQHPEIVSTLKTTYDGWWKDVRPYMINDELENVPAEHKPYHERYRKAFGEAAYKEAMEKMTWTGGKPFGDKKKKKSKARSAHD
ncbi:sulfatase-like hydrolase/transferase [Rubritalea spongiae]|uniref:Sulfatase-like hydrolase/transferase n=1 Tax=Rubritalea spongiae TaxID=430797 RepID=A0ABW5E1F5_9BACT